ncbi:MAG: hypothetical protein EOO04_01160 [Chitinophagaceae bacterium]|nr:MAG: hypothetical protein EOO04_01160 [Chitinophagaceae bacterium]
MKKPYFYLAALAIGVTVVAAFNAPVSTKVLTAAGVQSMSAITFSPEGTLFIGDSKSASVFAVPMVREKKQNAVATFAIKNIDQKIAGALGTNVANITITDMAVHPVSKQLYIAVQHSDGTPVLLKLNGDQLTNVSLKDMPATTVQLNNAPAPDAKDNRGRSLRISAVSDIGYSDGKLLVSGLSNHEFSSSFKSIPYPFTNKQDETTLEIYHAAHGRYETTAPIKTFTTATINNKAYLVASYTCTPLVLFPLDELKPGLHVKGRTVAEMGSGNTPIDMLTLGNGNDAYLLMANTKHPVAKVDYKSIAAFEGTLAEPVKGTAGVNFTATPTTNVLQMDKLTDRQVVMIQKQANGDIDLLTSDATTL